MLRFVGTSMLTAALSFTTIMSSAGVQSSSSRAAAPAPCDQDKSRTCVVLDDFESYSIDALPTRWQTNHEGQLVPVTPEMVDETQRVLVKEEGNNKFVRFLIEDQAYRLFYTNGNQFDWNLNAYPYLRWKWRAIELPEGADESDRHKNDTGAALYVTFGRDWLGRPKSIKYTYSSTLPIGTTTAYGPLKVIVVASAPENGTGSWMNFERNVVEDYTRLFGEEPPARPIGIQLFSDSDSVDGDAIVDFDDVMLLSSPS